MTISRLQWRAFWRRVNRAGHLNAGNQGILLIFAVLVLVRYLRALHTAAISLPQGETRTLDSLLLVILLVWMFPPAGSARTSISIRKLLHLPLTLKELFGIRLITLFIPPYSWVILGGSLAICYPIVRARNPVAATVAALLFVVFSALSGLTIAQLLSMRLWRRLFFSALMLTGLIVFYLVQTAGVGRLVSLSSALPTALVSRAAVGAQPWTAVGQLAVLTTLTVLTALWSFKKSLAVIPKRRTQKITIFDSLGLRGGVGGLAAKDFRYFRRLLDPYLGVLVAALGSFYLVVADAPSAGFLQVFLLSVFVPSSPLAFDSFGLDNRAGLDRLRLMPVTGRTILLGKNLAFAMIVGLQAAPLILLGAWRLGLPIAALGIVEAIALTATYLAWGNWMSVNHPLKMQFFQFSSSSGLVVEALAGIMLGSLPGMITIYVMHTEGFKASWKIGLVLLVSLAAYLLVLSYVSTRFESKQSRILQAVS